LTFGPALSREFRPYKPDPGPLLHICSAWEVLPNEVMMIGDSLKDDVSSFFLSFFENHILIIFLMLCEVPSRSLAFPLFSENLSLCKYSNVFM
jgi:hypothetical protein